VTNVRERHEVWMHTDVHQFEQSFKGDSCITEIILKCNAVVFTHCSNYETQNLIQSNPLCNRQIKPLIFISVCEDHHHVIITIFLR